MTVKILSEAFNKEALLGLSLSYNKYDINTQEGFDETLKIAESLAFKGNGHNKFLSQIKVCIDITASRQWWQEFDTYKVETREQSESTMHTITKSKIDKSNFNPIKFESDQLQTVYDFHLNSMIDFINLIVEDNSISKQDKLLSIKGILPESFLQRRIVTVNYMILQNIYFQRKTHKLPEWKLFLSAIEDQIFQRYFIFPEHKHLPL